MTKKQPNFAILGIVVFLVFFGLLMISSAGAVLSQEKFNQSFYFVKNQILKGLLPGLVLAFLAYRIPFQFWRKYAKYIFIASLALMILVFIPGLGVALGGAKRWVNLAGIYFQPSEFFKLALIVYLAAFLAKNSESVSRSSYGILSFLLILGLLGFLIGSQPDIGTFSVLVAVTLTMFFLAGTRLSHIAFLSGAGLALLLLLIKIFSHARERIQVLFDPRIDPKGIGYQIDQIKIALGSGGIFGQGLTQSKQKFLYLPQPTGDSIAAVIGEELGFVGMVTLVGLFAAFAFYGFKVAQKAPDEFSKLLAGGITCLIVIQALVNISAIIGLLPLTGITLPFISYGGSSLVVSLIAVGILLNISKHSHV